MDIEEENQVTTGIFRLIIGRVVSSIMPSVNFEDSSIKQTVETQ